MIRLTRGPKPKVLAENEERWTKEYAELRAGGDVPKAAAFRYRDPEIKEAVIRDSHRKCIYCESRPLHVTPGDVEHQRPKSKFPQEIVNWENLGFVCPDCNREKGDFHDDAEPMVDPFNEDPAMFIRFAGPAVFEQPGSRRGIVSIRKLSLDRAELLERRGEHLRKVQSLLNSWAALPDGPARDEIASEVRALANDPGEYAAATRAFLALEGPDVQ